MYLDISTHRDLFISDGFGTDKVDWGYPNLPNTDQAKYGNLKYFMISFIKEFIEFLTQRKKYWLLPIIIVLFLFGALIVLSQGSAIAPFIYTIF